MGQPEHTDHGQRHRRRGRGNGGNGHGGRGNEFQRGGGSHDRDPRTHDDGREYAPAARRGDAELRDAVDVTPVSGGMPIGWKVLLWLLVLGTVVVVASQAPVIIRPGERGVLSTMGKVQPEVLGEGTHFIIPFWQRVDRASAISSTTVQEMTVLTKDRLPVQVRMAVEFRPDSRELPNVLRDTGLGALDTKVVIPALLAVPDGVVGQRSAEAVLDRRTEAADAVRAAVNERVGKRGVRFEAFDVTFSFPAETLGAVAAQKAEAKRLAEEAAKEAAKVPPASPPAPPGKAAPAPKAPAPAVTPPPPKK